MGILGEHGLATISGDACINVEVPEVNTYLAKYTAHTPPSLRLGCTTGRAD